MVLLTQQIKRKEVMKMLIQVDSITREQVDDKVNNWIDKILAMGELTEPQKRKMRRHMKDMVSMVRESEKKMMADFINR